MLVSIIVVCLSPFLLLSQVRPAPVSHRRSLSSPSQFCPINTTFVVAPLTLLFLSPTLLQILPGSFFFKFFPLLLAVLAVVLRKLVKPGINQ